MIKEITATEFKTKYLNNLDTLELIDVREESEFNQIKIKGSKLIPINQLGQSLNEIDWSKEVIFICRTGARSEYVTSALKEMGYEGINLAGGINILRMNCEECIEKGDLNRDYFY
ncbi:MAG: rhodanese-like domain-containing protein [Candidatus Gracilibacteria bacterium]|nr:rhodanese-like domain-containing protein [Candidatus Gracilibacteria bacterium]